MGEEGTVLVVVDPTELPRSWAAIQDLSEKLIGDAEYRVLPSETAADAREAAPRHLPQAWASEVRDAAQVLQRTVRITLGDRHLDAKLFVHLHPFGTGSLRSEEGSGGIQMYAQNRLLSLESAFRRSAVWSFFMLERMIKNDLYFAERARKSATTIAVQTTEPTEQDQGDRHDVARSSENYARLFGRVDPRQIPESGGGWKARRTELMAISDEHELGLMTGMITSTQNDNSAELLAHARRGPCATATDDEMYEYLLTRHAPGERRANVQADAAAATLSFQSRTHALKCNFLNRGKRTPIGIPMDYWDRTEAQM